jgi:hypothetical protein
VAHLEEEPLEVELEVLEVELEVELELEVDLKQPTILRILRPQFRPDHQEEAGECLIEAVDLLQKQCPKEYLKEAVHLVEVEQVEDVVLELNTT